ncbi:LOW QUALITY PROTEIN: anti-Muellerian hormone type-2 receptor [Morphnus guianensis]
MTISFCNKHESLALSGNLRGFDRGSTANSAWGGGGGIQSQVGKLRHGTVSDCGVEGKLRQGAQFRGERLRFGGVLGLWVMRGGGGQRLAPTQGALSHSPPCCGGCTFLLLLLLLLLLPRGCLRPGPAFLFPPAPARILPTPSPQPEAPMGLVPGLPGPRNLSCVSYKHPSVRGGLGGSGGAKPGTVRCPPGQCCIGIWNQSHALVQGENPPPPAPGPAPWGAPVTAAVSPGCWGGGGAACPSPTCTPSPAGPPGGGVLVCLCHGHLCNGNASGMGTALGLGGPHHSPVPGHVGSAGTLWLWGAGPLLLLLTCLAVLGRDRDTGGGTRDLGTPGHRPPPYPVSPGCPWVGVSPNATSLVSPGCGTPGVGGPQVPCHSVPGAGGSPVNWGALGVGVPGWGVPRMQESPHAGILGYNIPCVPGGVCGGVSLVSPGPVSLIMGGVPGWGCHWCPCVPRLPPGLRRARTHTRRPPRGCRGVGVPPEPPSPDLPALHFLQVLQTGRFSAVWRGTLQQRPVAIKAFVAGAAGRFAAERAVHGLPLMEHDNVARLLGTRGAGPRARGGLLVLQLYPAGSLRHFLEQHVGTWAGSVRLALSLARGLAFLHQELWRDGLYKPSVVHRDLSSQNVLVREDGTCAIGDFGLALALPPRAQAGTSARHVVPIRKAGTQRYLAPEILDESLDLRAWGRALRQADVYALALLLWEILSRCQALSPGAPVPAFRLAYEAELGASPTGAQLRRLAVEERRRPLIPPAWHRAPQPGGALPELLEDCWDPDPEARLSAEPLQRLQRLAAGPPPPATGPPQPAATATAPSGGSGLRTAPPAADREPGVHPAPGVEPSGRPRPRFLPGGAAAGAEAAGPGAVTCHVGPWCRATAPPQPCVPPKPHVPPPAPTPQPGIPPPARIPPPRGTPKPAGGARAAPVPPHVPPIPPRGSLGPLRAPPVPDGTPGVPHPAPWGAPPVPPRAGQEGGEEDEEEDEEGSEEAQALFLLLLLLLLQQRLRLRPPPPPGTRVPRWPPGTTHVLPWPTVCLPVTTQDHSCPPV